MAHDLLIQGGQARMMYYGEEPWHGLGTKLDHPATAEEAIKAAGLDWQVVKTPLAYIPEAGKIEWMKDRFAIMPGAGWQGRDRPAFGVVGSAYKPLQNREAFEFFDPIVGKDAAVYHTAGALEGGRRIWILAKLPDDIRVLGDDITEKYLLLTTSHDGESAIQIKFTPVRVVCQNTLCMALASGKTFRVRHTRDIHERLKQAHELLGIIHNQYSYIEDVCVAMSGVKLDRGSFVAYVKQVFPDPADPESEEELAHTTRDRSRAEYFFEYGRGNQARGVAGTLWAAYNGVVEYMDYERVSRVPEARLNSIWHGRGARVKIRAFEIAKTFCAS